MLIAQSGTKGYGIALDLASYKRFFPDVPQGVSYYLAFTHVVHHFIQRGSASAPAAFTFDHRKESDYNAGRLYDHLINRPDWAEHPFLDTKVPFDSRQNPRIQIADLVARETMKVLDNQIGPKTRPMRKSIRALDESLRFSFDLWGKDWFRSYSESMPELERVTGLRRQDYQTWLENQKLIDNESNKLRFIVWREQQDSAS